MLFFFFFCGLKPLSSALKIWPEDVSKVGSMVSRYCFICWNHSAKDSFVITALSRPSACPILSATSGCLLKNACIQSLPGRLSLKTVFAPLASRMAFTISLTSSLVRPKPRCDSSISHCTSFFSTSSDSTVLGAGYMGLLPLTLSPRATEGIPNALETPFKDICIDFTSSTAVSTCS